MEAWIGIVSVVLGAFAGGLATLVATRNRVKLERQVAYDRELRGLRLPHYQRLHHASRCIPREWRSGEEPARQDALGFRETFHNWYFGPHAGGLFLTEEARRVYFDLQNELQTVGRRDAGDEPAALTPEESTTLRKLASDLRHQLREDLGTAEPPQLKWTDGGPTPAPPRAS